MLRGTLITNKQTWKPTSTLQEERGVFNFGLIVRGLSKRPNLPGGPRGGSWRSIKEEKELTLQNVPVELVLTLDPLLDEARVLSARPPDDEDGLGAGLPDSMFSNQKSKLG
jgi:hypothetical protein